MLNYKYSRLSNVHMDETNDYFRLW